VGEPVKTYRYSVPNENHQGWAILFLDDAGCCAVLSDYGNYTHRWSSGGFAKGEDIRAFLLTAGDDYLLGKLAQRVPSLEKTAAYIREQIIERRRSGWWEKEEAAEEWERARDLEGQEISFEDWMTLTRFDDAYEFHCTEYDPQAVAFFKRAWPRLRALIAAEVAHCEVRMISLSKVLRVGCGDNSCVWGSPGGMATNGGCRCYRDERRNIPERHALRRAARMLRELATGEVEPANEEFIAALGALIGAEREACAFLVENLPRGAEPHAVAAAIRARVKP